MRIADLAQSLGDGLLRAAQGIVDVVVRDLLELLDLILRGAHHIVGLILGLEVDGLLRDELAGLCLRGLHDILCLALCVRNELAAGVHDGLCLLQLAGELVADLVEQVEDLFALNSALIAAERHGACVLHHFIQGADQFFNAVFVHDIAS